MSTTSKPLNNTQKTIRNSAVSVIAQICALILQYANRKVFVLFLDIEYLGYHSLFTSVFSLLSVAELGISGIFAFHLYKEVADRNTEEIGKLMYLYKWMYRIVAGVIVIGGVICYYFLPYFVKDASASLDYLRLIYSLQLSSVIFGYFLMYKRTLYVATQQEYKCVQIDLAVSVVIQILQLAALAAFRNYIIYLSIQLSTSVISNIIISYKYNKDFPELKKRYNVSKEYIKSRNMFADLRDIIIHRISYAIYGGADDVIISSILGVRMVGLFGNYIVIQKGVMQLLFYKLLDPVQATIGNIVHSDRNKDELWSQFEMLDVFSYFFATYIGIGFYTLYQPFISIWMGREYQLPDQFVLCFSITIYLWAVWEIVYKYRNAFGDYKQDRWMMLLSAVLNIGISIPGARLWGVTGVQLGTLISFFPIAYGRIRFVVGNYFGRSIGKYFLKHFVLMLFAAAEAFLCRYICDMFDVSIPGILLRCLVILVLPTVFNCALYSRNENYKRLTRFMKTIISSYILHRNVNGQ